MRYAGDKSLVKITAASVVVIFVMLLAVYRSPVTVILLLLMVGIEFAAARIVVALLGQAGVIGLSTFAINLLSALTIAAGPDNPCRRRAIRNMVLVALTSSVPTRHHVSHIRRTARRHHRTAPRAAPSHRHGERDRLDEPLGDDLRVRQRGHTHP
jgi:membrane-bound ClpP family serine protease